MGFEEESPWEQLSEEDELYVLHDIHAMPRSEISAPLKIEDKDCLKKLDQVRGEGVRQVRSQPPQVPEVHFFIDQSLKQGNLVYCSILIHWLCSKIPRKSHKLDCQIVPDPAILSPYIPPTATLNESIMTGTEEDIRITQKQPTVSIPIACYWHCHDFSRCACAKWERLKKD